MNITAKIENYDSMSAEEKLAALESLEIEEPDGTKPTERESKLKSALDKTSSEVATLKKQLKEKMTESERLEAERAEKMAEQEKLLAEYQRKDTVSNQVANFLSVGFSKEDAQKSAEALVDGDFDTVFGGLKTFIENRDKAVKAELLKSTPRPDGGNSGEPTMTKEQFDKMGYTERAKLFEENRELYNELSK